MKTCVLFSGGWDSMVCALMHNYADLLFFDYGQNYINNEFKSAHEFSTAFDKKLITRTLRLAHNQHRRNFFLILEAKRLGYENVIVGARNVLPMFDAYKDSNFMSLKILGWLLGIKITLPVAGWTKSRIVKFVRKSYAKNAYNCYSNNQNIEKCDCRNCAEMRKIKAFYEK